MAENENVVTLEEQPAVEPLKVSKGQKIWGGIKEWFRKFTVKLKRRPMNIAFFVLIVSSIMYLCSLGNLSQTTLNYSINWLGLCVFVNTLFCILSLLLFMNSFPKRAKKPKIVMLVIYFLFIAAMLAFDVVFYVLVNGAFSKASGSTLEDLAVYTTPALSCTLAHIVLVGVAAILTATYPLYGKLLNKINTRKVVESAELKEEIDTSAEV